MCARGRFVFLKVGPGRWSAIHVQAFFSELPVEALDRRVLRGLAALDEVQRHLILIRPLIHDAAGELRSVVDLNRGWYSTSFSQPLQHPHYAQTRQRHVGLDPQCLSRVAIDQVQRSEFPPTDQFVIRVVHRPYFIRTRRKRQRHSRFGSKPLAPPASLILHGRRRIKKTPIADGRCRGRPLGY